MSSDRTGKVTSGKSQDVTLALSAMEQATVRWKYAGEYSEIMRVEETSLRFAAIGEALFWASSVHDMLGLDCFHNDLCRGMKFARNRVTHSIMVTTVEQPGFAFPIEFPMRFSHFEWVEASHLPLPDTGKGAGSQARKDRESYSNAWAGKDPAETLTLLLDHLQESSK